MAPGTQITPAATVHNHGNVAENIPVTFALAGGPTAYSDLQTTGSVDPDATAPVTFAQSAALAAGYYTMTATTSLAGDANAGNNTQTDHFLVLGQPVGLTPNGGWLTSPARAPTTSTLTTTATSVHPSSPRPASQSPARRRRPSPTATTTGTSPAGTTCSGRGAPLLSSTSMRRFPAWPHC